MNPVIQLKNATPVFLIALACFGLSPKVRAVVPPPDGGYPNRNTAEGDFALFNLTSGSDNTAIGFGALFSNTFGIENTATGSGALQSNTTGIENTAIGFQALFMNNGLANTAIGAHTLRTNTIGANNTAIGDVALSSNTSGIDNTATGVAALNQNTIGRFNTANGVGALQSNTTGSNNTANGFFALFRNTTAIGNTASGFNALLNNRTGFNNTANGRQALENNTSSFNIGLGNLAGRNLTTGGNNIDIGNQGMAGEARTIRIGEQGNQLRTFIAGISGSPIAGTSVVVNNFGRLGTVASSQRFKEDIKSMDKASEAIHALKPVTFRYKQEIDPDGIPQFGLVGEQVEKVNPDLVARDEEGKVYTVRYEAVNAMLLNEFLKEHRKVEDLKKDFQATVGQQQKEIAALAATVKEQASQIQRVSAQLETNKPAPQVVNNP
jgi:trimeric autotransporter adhesin